MAVRNRAIVVTRWVRGSFGPMPFNKPAILDDLPPGISVTDVTNQSDGIIPPTPNVYIAEVDGLTNAQLTALNALPAYFVLMSESYDDQTQAIAASTYDDVPTGAQLTNFANALKTRFPDIDDDKLQDAGQAAFRAGLTRRQILTELVKRWRKFQKG